VGVARQQSPPDRTFEPLDVLADGRLPETEPFGSQREASHLFDGNKAAELGKIEHGDPEIR
jgi:hypothetical protein